MASNDTVAETKATVSVLVKAAKDLYSADAFGGKSDPYVVVSIGEISAKTASKQNETSPEFNETLSLELSEKISAGDELKIQVYDDDTLKDDSIGHAFLKLTSENVGGEEVWCDLVHGDGEKQGSICIAVSTTLDAATKPSQSVEDSKTAEAAAEGKSTEAVDAVATSEDDKAEAKAEEAAAESASESAAANDGDEDASSSAPKQASDSSHDGTQQVDAVESKDGGEQEDAAAAAEAGDSAPDAAPRKEATAESAAETKSDAPTQGTETNADKARNIDAKPTEATPEEPATSATAAPAPESQETKADSDEAKPQEKAAPAAEVAAEAPEKKATVEEIEAYLQQRVVPVLQEGLTQLAEVQPAKPLGWLAKYIALHAAAE